MNRCLDCGEELSKWSKYEPILRCRLCCNKASYKRRLPIIKCAWCGKEVKATSFRQKYCKTCVKRNNKKYRSEINKRYWNNNSKKRKARSAAGRKIIIPKGTLCEHCKKNLAVQRHHPDYNKPLKVKLLCFDCHKKIKTRRG